MLLGGTASHSYTGEEVCVVGLGCVLPHARDVDSWWHFLLEAKPAFADMPAGRLDPALYLGSRGSPEDQTYTHRAAWIDEEMLADIAAKGAIERKGCTRFELLLFEATRQALCGLPADLVNSRAAGMILGSMNQDETISQWEFLLEWPKLMAAVNSLRAEKTVRDEALSVLQALRGKLEADLPPVEKSTIGTAALEILRERFGISGEGWFVDAACASSLAAVHAAAAKIQNRELDLVITGGVEANLSPESFALFSRLGVLASDLCLPLSSKSTGMLQGEGAVVFALTRVSLAKQRNLPIHGVLRGIAGTTSVRSNALFAPDAMAQLQAVQNARLHSPGRKISYLECHATGTAVGDEVEAEALDRAYADRTGPLPVASVKALIGHTKSCAGAAGLLKCLLIVKSGTVPPGVPSGVDPKDFLSGSAVPRAQYMYVPRHSEPLHNADPAHPVLVGLNSAGFGGINYHCLVEAFDSHRAYMDARLSSQSPSPPSPFFTVLVGKDSERAEGIRERVIGSQLRLAPSTLGSIDDSHLQALLAAKRLVESLKVASLLDSAKVSVIAASSDALPAASNLSRRVRYNEFRAAFESHPKAADLLYKLRETLPALTEDSGPGVLNNVLASRVAQTFGFSGVSVNVDADLVGFPYALGLASTLLRSGEMDAVLLVSVERYIDSATFGYTSGPETFVHLLVREETAELLHFPRLGRIGAVGLTLDSTRKRSRYDLCLRSTPPEIALGGTSDALKWKSCFGDEVTLSVMLEASQRSSANPETQHKKVAVAFAGQGANFPGMFREHWAASGFFREGFARADAICLKECLPAVSGYVLTPDELSAEQLHLLQNLALFVAQVALYEGKKEMIRPAILSAHSFGEFAMLVAAGCVTFEAMFKYLIARETLAPSSNIKGWLVAAGGGFGKVSELLRAAYPELNASVAIVNSPDQCVVAVPPDQLEALLQAMTNEGIRSKVLPTAQPYHSSFLRQYEDRLATFIDHFEMTVNSPNVPFVSSVLGQFIDRSSCVSELVPKILRSQLTTPINFSAQIALAANHFDPDHWYEIGPRTILLPFIAASQPLGRPQLSSWSELYQSPGKINHGRAAEVHSLDPASSRIVALIGRVISKVTGYQLEGISIEDRMQDDLGIDSIKHAEIVFTTLGQLQKDISPRMDLRKFKTVRDLVEYAHNRSEEAPDATLETLKADFCVYRHSWIKAGYTQKMPRNDRGGDDLVLDMREGSGTWREITEDLRIRRLAIVLGPVIPSQAIGQLHEVLTALASVSRVVGKAGAEAIYLITDESDSPLNEAVRAFAKSWCKELYREGVWIRIKIVAIAEIHPQTELFEWLDARDVLLKDEYEVKIQSGQVCRRELEIFSLREPTVEQELTTSRGMVLAFGGAQGITFNILSQLGADLLSLSSLVVVGRSSQDQQRVQQAVAALRNAGYQSVFYEQCDATNAEAVHDLFKRLNDKFGTAALVINGAGIEISRSLAVKTPEEIRREIEGKILPAMNIQRAAETFGTRSLVHFTSIVGAYGNPGQTVYAAANAFIHGCVMEKEESVSGTRTLAVAWPPWDAVGMTADPVILQSLRAAGLALLSSDKGAELFRKILRCDARGVLYVASPADQMRYEFGLREWRDSFPRWDDVDVDAEKIELTGVWDASEWEVLADHKVDGVMYLPAAVQLQMLIGILRMSGGGGPFEIRNFKSLRPFSPGLVPQTVKLTLLTNSQHGMREVIFSAGMPVFQAQIGPDRSMSDDHPEPWGAAAQVMSGGRDDDGLSQRREDVYGADGLFHGPSFHCLSGIRCNEGRYWARISPQISPHISSKISPKMSPNISHSLMKGGPQSSSSRIHSDEFQTTRLLDGVMQLAAFAASDLDGRSALPTGVEKLVFADDPIGLDMSDDYLLTIEEIPDAGSNGGTYRFNGVLQKMNGAVIASLEGLTAQCRNTEQKVRRDSRDGCRGGVRPC